MFTGRLVFSQVMDFMPLPVFRRCVAKYQGDFKVQKFSCLDQYLCMAFAQITYRESLRDTVTCLRSQSNKLYHMGIRGNVRRSTLADANELRDWRIYAELAHALIAIARDLYSTETFLAELDETVYALDSTTIDLCLSVFPWAPFRKSKAAIKLHTLLDLRGNIPTFIHISDGKLHECNALDLLTLEPGAFYVMDRGYVDFERLYTFTLDISIFCHPRQVKHPVPAAIFSSGRPHYRFDLRPDHCAHRGKVTQCISRETAAGQISRSRNRQDTGVSDEQLFRPAGSDDRPIVPFSLAGGTVFQMDQAKPQDQELLRDIRKRGEVPDLDSGLRVRSRGDHEKTAPAPGKPLHNSTDLSVNIFGKSTIYQLITDHDCKNKPALPCNQLKLFE